MDIKAYIASGILEMYVLEQTSEKESKEVEVYVRKYPEIAAELRDVQNAFLKINYLNAKPIKNNLLNRILEKINNLAFKMKKLNGHNLNGMN